jgi:hypothetical protein
MKPSRATKEATLVKKHILEGVSGVVKERLDNWLSGGQKAPKDRKECGVRRKRKESIRVVGWL